MAKTKLLYELEEDYFNFQLIALKSTIFDDYLFIYKLNSLFKMQFERAKNDLEIIISNQEYWFSVYTYNNQSNHIQYTIFNNISQEKEISNTMTLFGKETIKIPLFKSLKFYNYLLKIEADFSNDISLDLQNISYITHYQKIEVNNLKNKDYLILP